MAPLKRRFASRELLSSDDSESSSVDSRKRRRSSKSVYSPRERQSSSEGEDLSSRLSPQLGEYENEDELELQATQIIQEKYSLNSDEPNVPADHGIIERVDCYNFMCHEHFSVDLGPLINFIVGKNGSGKSAILTALTLCLGGKASATNRGQSLKSFIKEGKESATIVVRIKNQGDGAYMPEEYGRSIIVERSFSRNGTSGFKIKNESGRIVSTKKIDLDAITDFFNLQIDNPMNVLSQDMARQFLSTSSPAEKYKFFVKGVQLEQLDHDYRLIEESVDQIENKVTTRVDDIKILENNRERAKRRLELSDQHASLRDRIRNLRSQMAWAQVEEQERIRDSLDGELRKSQERIIIAESEVAKYDNEFESIERESEEAAQLVGRTIADLERVQDEKKEVKSRFDGEMNERHDLQAEQRQVREALMTVESSIQELQQAIADETKRIADINGGSYAEKNEQLERQRQKVLDAKRRLDEHRQDEHRLHEDIRKAKEEVELNAAPLGKQESEIEQAEALLKSLTKDRGAQDAGFPDKMPQLLRAIRQESSFRKVPVGPIGHHVRLLKPEWSAVLENSFGATLNSFIVTSKSDMNLLSSIMQKVKCNCPIFIGSEGAIDTTEFEPDAKFDTALRVLEIDNDIVRRQLIINHGIEQVLLIERLEDASAVLFEGQRPTNVRRCYTIDQTDRRRGIHLSYSRTGEPTQTPVAAFIGRPRMRTDTDSQIRLQRQTIEHLQNSLKEMERRLGLSRSQLHRCIEALARHKQQHQELEITAERLDDEADEMSDMLARDTVEEGRLEGLRNALKDAEEERSLNTSSSEDGVAAMDSIMAKLKATKRQMANKDTEIASLEERKKIAENEQAKVTEQRRRLLSEKNAAIGRVNVLKQEISKMEQKREQLVARVLDYSEKASLVSSRVPVDQGETPNSLDKKLDRLHRDMQRFNDEMGASREEIAAEALRTNNAYQRAKQQIEEFKTLAEIFKDTLRNRRNRWDLFRAHISSRAKAQFTYLLSERSFRGRLLADHEGKLMDLQVEPDITKESTGRGAKTLSGGEKSFSQVCLLLSLWEAMGSPIRCLDEFDVYMDSVNRKMAIDMLMTAARRSIGRQFILITPGSRAEISLAPDVRVKELAEPERGQRTLPFGAA